MADFGPTATLIGVASRTPSSSIIGRSRGSETTIFRIRPSGPSRRYGTNAVAQHQVGRNRPEQLLVDPERVHVDELEPVALGQPARLLDFSGAVAGAELGVGVERREAGRVCVSHQDVGQHRAQLEERHVERQQERGDDDAHDHEQQRFDQRDEPLHVGRDLLVVEVGDGVQHLLERAGRLADFGHLDGHVGENAARLERRRERLPFAHARRHDLELAGDVLIADRPGRDVERVDERQAAAEQRRQRPRHLRRRELARDLADHRHAQDRGDRAAPSARAAAARTRTPRPPPTRR